MLINKYILIIILVFQIMVASQPLSASQMIGRDKVIFKQAIEAIDNSNWMLARSLLSSLHNQLPENIEISNNLAVALFNLGEVEKSQQLFSSILEQNKLIATAYKNLKKLYSYSAAKTYSTGLNLLKPVGIPQMIVLNENIDISATSSTFQTSLTKGTLDQPALVKLETKVKTKVDTEAAIKIEDKAKTKTDKTKVDKTHPAEIRKILPAGKLDNNVDSEILLKRLEKWRNSWVSGNTKEYISMYKKNYSPSAKSRKTWLKNRQARVVKSKKIKVLVKNSKVYVDKLRARANILFDQNYSSDNYSDQVLKRLYWIKEDGKWVIERESIIKTL